MSLSFFRGSDSTVYSTGTDFSLPSIESASIWDSVPALAPTTKVDLSGIWIAFPKADSQLVSFLFELVKEAFEDILTSVQVIILIKKLKGQTYKSLRKEFQLSNENIIARILEKTVLGIKWSPGIIQGRPSVLSDVDARLFAEEVDNVVLDINCLATCTAREIAAQLNKNRMKRARYILQKANCMKLASSINSEVCKDDTWLKKFCSKRGIRVTSSQELEAARRAHCDVRAISVFFDEFGALLDRDHRLIFNMDETMISSKKEVQSSFQDRKAPIDDCTD